MPKGQRKPKQELIRQDQFENMCAVQCTEEEIASIFGVSIDTLERWCKRTYRQKFAEVFKAKRQVGRASLRRKQWLKATDEMDTTMLIFLGKQYLGQADRTSQTITTISSETRDQLSEIMKSIDEEYAEEYEGKVPQVVEVTSG